LWSRSRRNTPREGAGRVLDLILGLESTNPYQELSTRGASRGAVAPSAARSARAWGTNLAPGTPLRKCSLSRCPSRRSATMHSSTLAWDTLDSSPQVRQTGWRGVCVTAILDEGMSRARHRAPESPGRNLRARLVASHSGDLYRLEHSGISSLQRDEESNACW